MGQLSLEVFRGGGGGLCRVLRQLTGMCSVVEDPEW